MKIEKKCRNVNSTDSTEEVEEKTKAKHKVQNKQKTKEMPNSESSFIQLIVQSLCPLSYLSPQRNEADKEVWGKEK
jgi:hypothetical protein